MELLRRVFTGSITMAHLPGVFESGTEDGWTDVEIPATLFWVDVDGRAMVEQTVAIALGKDRVRLKSRHLFPLLGEIRVALKFGSRFGSRWGRVEHVSPAKRDFVVCIKFESRKSDYLC